MEEQKNPELEMLAKIHNQLVDLKQVIVEIELAKPGTSHSLQTRLRSLVGADEHVDGDAHPGMLQASARKVIAPTDGHIAPGEAKDTPTGAGQ